MRVGVHTHMVEDCVSSKTRQEWLLLEPSKRENGTEYQGSSGARVIKCFVTGYPPLLTGPWPINIERTLDENSGYWDPWFSFRVGSVVMPYPPAPQFSLLLTLRRGWHHLTARHWPWWTVLREMRSDWEFVILNESVTHYYHFWWYIKTEICNNSFHFHHSRNVCHSQPIISKVRMWMWRLTSFLGHLNNGPQNLRPI